MTKSSPIARLTDIVDAIEIVRAEMTDVALTAFESDRRKRWQVERGIEIISQANRRLPDERPAFPLPIWNGPGRSCTRTPIQPSAQETA